MSIFYFVDYVVEILLICWDWRVIKWCMYNAYDRATWRCMLFIRCDALWNF